MVVGLCRLHVRGPLPTVDEAFVGVLWMAVVDFERTGASAVQRM